MDVEGVRTEPKNAADTPNKQNDKDIPIAYDIAFDILIVVFEYFSFTVDDSVTSSDRLSIPKYANVNGNKLNTHGENAVNNPDAYNNAKLTGLACSTFDSTNDENDNWAS